MSDWELLVSGACAAQQNTTFFPTVSMLLRNESFRRCGRGRESAGQSGSRMCECFTIHLLSELCFGLSIARTRGQRKEVEGRPGVFEDYTVQAGGMS